MTDPTKRKSAERPVVHEGTMASKAFDWTKVGAFVLGVVFLAVWGMAEVTEYIGLDIPTLLGQECNHNHAGEKPVPWGLILISVLLIAPAMVGRTVAGEVFRGMGDVLRALATRIRGGK